MLGAACSPCCTPPTPCYECPEGELPDTVTVTFGDIPYTLPVVVTTLSVSSPCGGGGATASLSGTTADPLGEGYPEAFRGPIEGATVTNGGSGYAAYARVAPTLTVTGQGTGGTFSVTLSETVDECGLSTWSVESASVEGDCLVGYGYDEQLSVTAEEGTTTVVAAQLLYRPTRAQPTVTATAASGEGATLTVTLSAVTIDGVPRFWQVSSVSVSGGTGYEDSEAIAFLIGDCDQEEYAASATLTAGEDGVPTGVTVSSGGLYYRDSAADIVIDQAGQYYLEDQDATGTAYPVTLTLSQSFPSAGSGALFSAAVDIDPASETFGQITSVSVDDDGDGYVVTKLTRSRCAGMVGNQSVVATRIGQSCTYMYQPCATGSANGIYGETVSVTFTVGGDNAASVRLLVAPSNPGEDGSDVLFTTDETILNCGSFSLSLDSSENQSVTVTAGGDLANNGVIENYCPFPISFSALEQTFTIDEDSEPNQNLSCDIIESSGSWAINADAIDEVEGLVGSQQTTLYLAFVCPCVFFGIATHSEAIFYQENPGLPGIVLKVQIATSWFLNYNADQVGKLPSVEDFATAVWQSYAEVEGTTFGYSIPLNPAQRSELDQARLDFVEEAIDMDLDQYWPPTFPDFSLTLTEAD